MAESLIPVFTGTLSDSQSVQLCNARELHIFLEVKRDFSNWIKGRIRKFGFVAGEEFITISRAPELASGNRGASIDYHLTLDMAKQLSMVENNDQGKKARRYFIACEKQTQAASIPATLYVQALEIELREARSFALAQAGSRAMLLRKSEKSELLENISLMREAVQLRLALGYELLTA